LTLETISDRITKTTAEDGEAIFCHFLARGSAKEVTRQAFLDRARAFAAAFSRQGVKDGDVVIIILGHHVDTYCSFAAAILIGAIPSFLPLPSAKQDPETYWATHTTLLNRIKAKALVTTSEGKGVEQIPNLSTTEVIYVEEVSHLEKNQGLVVTAGGDRVAFLQHSSGTTGLKKGVALTHQTVLKNIDTYAQTIGLSDKDVIVSWLPLYHDMGLITSFLMPLVHGVPFVSIDPFEWVMKPTMLLDAVETYGGTFAWLPNFAFHHIANSAREGEQWKLSTLRALVSCSEPCKPQTMDEFARKFRPMGLVDTGLQTCYAMAENVFVVTQSPLAETLITQEQGGTDKLSCGKPMPGVEIKITDDQGTLLSEGEVGEILLRSDTMFEEYFKLPEDTEKAFRDGWYCTGDLGYLSEGNLFVTGRTKDLLIVRGINFYAHDVEFAANKVEGLVPGRCVALGLYDETSASEEVVLIAETQVVDGGELKGLKRQIKEQIFSHTALIIKSVEFVPKGWLIKTTSGKIARSQNEAKYQALKVRVC